MPIKLDRHQPGFYLFPVNNARTAWRPIGLPVIMVVPHRRDPGNVALPNSNIFNVRIFIEDVPQVALVAGHQHIGQRFPDKELYSTTLSAIQLGDRLLDINDLTITDADGNEIDIADATNGDTVHYTTTTGITDTFEYLIGADYYDLSDITIDVELLPNDRYNLVYQNEYFRRSVSKDGQNEFLCIDTNFQSLALLSFEIDHPGKVISEFYRLTPPPYLTNSEKSKDTTVALYRPFTDILNDAMDEQDLIPRINWVFEAPPEAIPYLSSLLGWDLPYFPESLDQLRKAVLRRTVEFQNLKGSRRAIINIFRLFGFEILISNLWWSSDGKRLIRPDENLPTTYENEKITTVAKSQVESLLSGYTVSDFTSVDIPLLFRPQELSGLDRFTALRDGGQATVIAYVVAPDSAADIALSSISDAIYADPSGYGETANCVIDANGFLFPTVFDTALAGKQTYGFSEIQISGKLGEPSNSVLTGPVVPINESGVSFNRETNVLSLTLNGNSEFSGYKVYVFAAYKRYEFSVPDVLANLESNRFDIQVLTDTLDELADPTTLEFAVEFLYRLKAFHSLLNVIRTSIDLTETYQVTNMCLGGEFAQRYDTDLGRLQVPPAIIPNIPSDPNDCSLLDIESLGYKESDIRYRLRILGNLPDEHQAWKNLDGRTSNPGGTTRIAPNSQAEGRDSCYYTPQGQDRVTVQDRIESREFVKTPNPNANMGDSGYPTNQLSAQDTVVNGEFDSSGVGESSNSDSSAFGTFIREYTELYEPFCEIDRINDYCYKGRVDDELLYRPTLKMDELGRIRPIYLGMGTGSYWTYPILTVPSRPGVKKPVHSLSGKMRYSGKAPSASIEYYKESVNKEYLAVSYDHPLPAKNNSMLGRLYRDYGTPENQTLHYTNRRGNPVVDQRYMLALQRPSLDITKPTLHLPGCRFPRMNALATDYVSTEYEARPWDQSPCGAKNICGVTDPTFLNYTKTTDTNGDEQLVFDSQQYTIVANGLTPDIPSFGDHTLMTAALFEDSDVIHKVYMKDSSSNPAVVLDQVCDYDSSVNSDETIETSDPIFGSHNSCYTDPTVYSDYADGYPCIRGYQTYTPPDLGQGVYDELLVGLGLSPIGSTDAPAQILFLLSSGIRDSNERGYRLDAGCLLTHCNPTIGLNALCSVSSYLDQDGEYDWEPDHLEIDLNMVLNEEIGVDLILLDGSVPSLMELV